MNRLTSIEEVFFPISEESVFLPDQGDGRRGAKVTGYKALINAATGNVLSVVNRDYRVITNREALDFAYQCANRMFGRPANEERLAVFKVDAPASGSFCHIDLAHPTYRMNLLGEGYPSETYIPFVRLTNSYNRARALRLDIGFCRALCTNGVIFTDDQVNLRVPHARNRLEEAGRSDVLNPERFAKKVNALQGFIQTVSEVGLSTHEAELIVWSVMRLPVLMEESSPMRPAQRQSVDALRSHVRECIGRYFDELGPTAYAAFNVMTDLATHGFGESTRKRDSNSMQRIAGNWLREIGERSRAERFDVSRYLDEIRQRSAISSSDELVMESA